MRVNKREADRIASITEAMKQHGPITVPRLAELTGWSPQTLRDQLTKSSEVFEQLSTSLMVRGRCVPATYYLRDGGSGMTEDEFERRADEACRDFNWWPSADQLLISAMRAMVTTGEQTWRQ